MRTHVGTVHDVGRYGTLRIYRDNDGGLYAFADCGSDVFEELWDSAPKVWDQICRDYGSALDD